MSNNSNILLQNVTSDIDGIPITCDGSKKTFAVFGTFAGGNVTLQTSCDGINWLTLTYNGNIYSATTNDIKIIDFLGKGLQLRAKVSGTSGCNLNAFIF